MENDFQKAKLLTEVGTALIRMRQRRPLIHHITNFVTMNDCANVTLAAGASPVMTFAVEEVVEMAAAAAALVLNMGTLQQWTFDAMVLAGTEAARRGIPIVLDPVGAGGTAFRTQAVRRLLERLPIAVIRGNLSEISCLAGYTDSAYAGVDNLLSCTMTVPLAEELSHKLGTVIAVTGPIDAVSDGRRTVLLGNGCPMLPYVTGTGCMTTSITACMATAADPFVAATGAVMTMGIAGELAQLTVGAEGPGTLHAHLMDWVYKMSQRLYDSYGKVLEYHESSD
jgi:hydroxyethylthiazole kinase